MDAERQGPGTEQRKQQKLEDRLARCGNYLDGARLLLDLEFTTIHPSTAN